MEAGAAAMVDKEEFRAFRNEMREELAGINRTVGKLSERVARLEGGAGSAGGEWSPDPVKAAT